MKKTVELSFAKLHTFAGDYYDDFHEAIKHASIYLYSRYGITISEPAITDGNQVVVELDMPGESQVHFSIGNHLRGISAYLLKKSKNKDYFATLLQGRRLLNYYIIEDHAVKAAEPPVSEEIKFLRDISEKLNRIESMLNEMKGEHNGL